MPQNEEKGGDFRDSPWYAVARFMGIGLEVAVAVVISLYAGFKLDEKFGHPPLFLIICLLIGFGVVINILINYSRAAKRDIEGNGDK
jgi:F0F1-type ATP synthase assembly protein I